MAAPVKNTCPDIDKIIKMIASIGSIAKDGMRETKSENDNLYQMFKDIEWDIGDIISRLEDLRSSNDALRTWGTELEGDVHSSAEIINELETENERLKETIQELYQIATA